MNNYSDYCTKLFGEHSCTEEDCPNCPSAKIISEHNKQIIREFLAWYSGGETMPSFGRYAKCNIDDVIAEWQKGEEND